MLEMTSVPFIFMHASHTFERLSNVLSKLTKPTLTSTNMYIPLKK
jgi:hypothetical protein